MANFAHQFLAPLEKAQFSWWLSSQVFLFLDSHLDGACVFNLIYLFMINSTKLQYPLRYSQQVWYSGIHPYAYYFSLKKKRMVAFCSQHTDLNWMFNLKSLNYSRGVQTTVGFSMVCSCYLKRCYVWPTSVIVSKSYKINRLF